jgi:DNA-binding NarL/FixJ family response regulator
MIRVLIVIPGTALRLGLRSIFGDAAGFRVVGEFSAFDQIPEAHPIPDVLITSHRSDLLAAAGVFAGGEPPGVLLVGEAVPPLRRLMPLGAWGILPENALPSDLLAAAQAVAAGLVIADPYLLVRSLQSPADEPAGFAPVELTGREMDVLHLLAEGLSNRQIAVRLGISGHTVKYHVSSNLEKLGAASRTEAVMAGIQRGLVTI